MRCEPVGVENRVTLCDLSVFVDHVTEPIPAQKPHTGYFHRRIQAPGGRILLQCPVRAVGVVMAGVVIEDEPQLALAGDQHPVQALAMGAGDTPLRDRVRLARPHGVCRAKTRLWPLTSSFMLSRPLCGIR